MQLNAVCQNPTDWPLLCNYVVCFLYVISCSLAQIFLYIASFDLCFYRRAFLFQVHVVEVLQSAVLSNSNFHFADHSVELSKIKCVAEIKLFVSIWYSKPNRRRMQIHSWEEGLKKSRKTIARSELLICSEHHVGHANVLQNISLSLKWTGKHNYYEVSKDTFGAVVSHQLLWSSPQQILLLCIKPELLEQMLLIS